MTLKIDFDIDFTVTSQRAYALKMATFFLEGDLACAENRTKTHLKGEDNIQQGQSLLK